jgi:hypothetical protein
MLDRVVISAPTRFSSSLLAWLARHGVGLVVLGRGGAEAAACMLGRPLATARAASRSIVRFSTKPGGNAGRIACCA